MNYMSRLTEEKKESIWKTFQETKSYAITAQIEKVDARTVSRIVKEKSQRATSSGSFADKPAEPRSKIIEPVQLKANELFETGSNTVQVSKTLKLCPSVVIGYRKEYNDMVSVDLDEELREKNDQKISLDQTIQQLSKSAQQLKRSIQESADSEKAYLQRIELAKNRCLEEEDRQKKIEVEGDVPSFIKNLESLQHSRLFEKLILLYKAKFFQKGFVRPVISATLISLMAHPNKAQLCAKINRTDGNSVPYDPLMHFDEADLEILVGNTAKRAQTVILGYADGFNPQHNTLEATAQGKQDGPSRSMSFAPQPLEDDGLDFDTDRSAGGLH